LSRRDAGAGRGRSDQEGRLSFDGFRRRRYPDFPHESTSDQLFSEEQFEVYRALGFHATRRMLRGWDYVAVPTGPTIWRGRNRPGIWGAARRMQLARPQSLNSARRP
jgi:hypothetical protein